MMSHPTDSLLTRTARHKPQARALRGAWILLVIVLLGADQASKYVIEWVFVYGERRHIIEGWFDLTRFHNPGAAFSFLANASGWQRPVLTALALLVSAILLWLIWREPQRRLQSLAYALIVAGALGNATDRLLHGYVIDFILLYHQQWFFPAFNIADTAITLGVLAMFVDEWRRWRTHRGQARS